MVNRRPGPVLPPGAFDDLTTRTMLAVLALDRPTLPALAEAVGGAHTSVYKSLLALRAAGLITWTPRLQATTHPTAVPTRPGDGAR